MTPIYLLFACAPSIDPGGGGGGAVSEVAAGEAVIDATSETEWVYLDLSEGQLVVPTTPETDKSWDLGFRRYRVKIDGGVSGAADMALVPYFGTDYDTALDAPTEGWITDEADADADGDPELALDSWFAYDGDSHEVTPAEVIYVVRDAAGDLAKLEFLSYYDEAGSPGYVRLRWGALSDEGTDDTGTTDTTVPFACSADASTLLNTDLGEGVTLTQMYTGSEEEWMCWSFASAGLVTEGWDLAMQKWSYLTAQTEVAALPGEDFDALTTAPAEGYLLDPEGRTIFENWYIYETENHTLEPDDILWVIHTAAGVYYKLQITTYYPGEDFEQPHWPIWKWAEIAPPAR